LGLIMNQSVRDNILLPNLDAFARIGWLDRDAGDRIVAEVMELVDIRPRRPELKASALSGGNQQKVILAKWLARRGCRLLLDEPTQGIDVAAKVQIHALIRDVVTRGGGALIHSSDLGELARLCDRVLAVRQGRIAAALDRPTSLDEPTLRNAIGGLDETHGAPLESRRAGAPDLPHRSVRGRRRAFQPFFLSPPCPHTPLPL